MQARAPHAIKTTPVLYKKYTFYLYRDIRCAEGKSLIQREEDKMASPTGFEPVLPP